MSVQINDIHGDPVQGSFSLRVGRYEISVSTIFKPSSLCVFNDSSRTVNTEIFGHAYDAIPSAENIARAIAWCLDQN